MSDVPISGSADEVSRAFEEAPVIMWSFEGPDHRIVAANRFARASVGDRPGLIGTPAREALPELAGQQIFEMMDDVYRTGRAVAENERRVLVHSAPGGPLHEAFYSYAFQPTRDETGAVRGLIARIIETTEVIRAARARSTGNQAGRRYQRPKADVSTLQRLLLPATVPVLPGISLAARYVVAEPDDDAGGDWFDAVVLDSGHLALAVGDVVGHGHSAAAVMGQLRAVALQALVSGADIVQVIARLDGLARLLPAARGTSLFIALLEPATGEFTYAGCAHPAPVIAGPDTPARILASAPQPPLGIGPATPVVVRSERLTAGETLVLYTDGLIERPGQTPDRALRELCAVTDAIVAQPIADSIGLSPIFSERLADLIVERFSWSGYRDDVTVLTVHAPAEHIAPLRVVVRAEPESLKILRGAVADWCIAWGVSETDLGALQHAVGEAAANAIEHAYAGGSGSASGVDEVIITGTVDSRGAATITIRDNGVWRAPTALPDFRGRGFALMRGLIEHVDVVRTPAGTTVRLRHSLHRDVGFGVAQPGRRPPANDTFGITVRDGDPLTLYATGVIDDSTIKAVRIEILHNSRGTVVPLRIDLTGVTHLASVGVRLLHELAASADPGQIELAAVPGSIAHQVLALTGVETIAVG